MGIYNYLVTLVILLLVNISLARPDDCPECTQVHVNGLTSTLQPSQLNGLVQLGGKIYYFETILKANWYKALQHCRSHGMHLASIASQEVSDSLERHINNLGLSEVRFWTSGTDQAEEGTFVWMTNGSLIVFKNWWAGEPNNSRQINNANGEDCLELWHVTGTGSKWNDAPCEIEKNFICEVQ